MSVLRVMRCVFVVVHVSWLLQADCRVLRDVCCVLHFTPCKKLGECVGV